MPLAREIWREGEREILVVAQYLYPVLFDSRLR